MSLAGRFTPGLADVDLRIVPLLDVAQEDARDRFRSQLQIDRHARNVVGREHTPPSTVGKCRGFDFLGIASICSSVIGMIRRAEVDGALGELADAAARADGLVVDLNIGVRHFVFVEPLLIDRVGNVAPAALIVSAPIAAVANRAGSTVRLITMSFFIDLSPLRSQKGWAT